MALSKTKQKRLTRLCKMINVTLDTLSEMEIIQIEYHSELLDVINQIRNYNQASLKKEGECGSTDLSFCEPTNNAQTQRSKSQANQNEDDISEKKDNLAEKDNTPPWVKLLWKKIMLKCHPDRIAQQNLPLAEIVKRQKYILVVQEAYKNENWAKVLYIGVLVEEFTENLTVQCQIDMLNNLLNLPSEKINGIKTSLAWQWGNEWRNLENRITIVKHCCQLEGIPVLPREDLIKILLTLD